MADGHPKTVLIADDDLAIVDVLGILLEEEGYAVAMITGGDVIQETQRVQPDVILLDVRLSGQDGREICRSLKRQDETKGIPIILVSANHDLPAIAQEAGADDHLAKPFDIDDLLTKIAIYTTQTSN
jgi:CheY-like chemotaxis protein